MLCIVIVRGVLVGRDVCGGATSCRRFAPAISLRRASSAGFGVCIGGAAIPSAVCSGLPDLPPFCYARFVPIVVHSLFVC